MKRLIACISLLFIFLGSSWAGSYHYTTSSAYESAHVVETTCSVTAPCNLYWFTALNHSGTAMMLMVFDLTAAPVDGAVTPKICVPASAATTSIDGLVSSTNPIGQPVQFTTGITFVLSAGATCTTKTATANGWFMVGSSPS